MAKTPFTPTIEETDQAVQDLASRVTPALALRRAISELRETGVAISRSAENYMVDAVLETRQFGAERQRGTRRPVKPKMPTYSEMIAAGCTVRGIESEAQALGVLDTEEGRERVRRATADYLAHGGLP